MAKEQEFIRINVREEISKNLARLTRLQAATTDEEGIRPPTVEALMEEGFSLAEALAIIAQWYIDHPDYEG